jgi:N4-(beta-N-acetylglucosaminyl)-L-asparaginase
MIAIDEKGNLSGACTTSGMAFKMHGRVGDSPIIGAGLFVDNEVEQLQLLVMVKK